MKVHDTQPLSAIEAYEPSAGVKSSQPAALEDDQVQVSDAARQLAANATAQPSTPDLNAIRAQIQQGTYKIDTGRTVEGILADASLNGGKRGN